jgi:mgtE-like transporter
VAVVAAAVAALALSWRSRLDELRRIVRESLPVLVVAGTVSAMAGIVLEGRFSSFDRYPALLVLVPAHLSSAGALGGILSGRLASKLALGLTRPSAVPDRQARRDIALVSALSVPVYAFNGLGAWVTANLLGHDGPGLGRLCAVSVLGGVIAVGFVVAVAYYAALAADRLGVDPDSYGIPLVSSSVDLVGAFTLVMAMAVLGLT